MHFVALKLEHKHSASTWQFFIGITILSTNIAFGCTICCKTTHNAAWPAFGNHWPWSHKQRFVWRLWKYRSRFSSNSCDNSFSLLQTDNMMNYWSVARRMLRNMLIWKLYPNCYECFHWINLKRFLWWFFLSLIGIEKKWLSGCYLFTLEG